jgi:hypothetical protein
MGWVLEKLDGRLKESRVLERLDVQFKKLNPGEFKRDKNKFS